MLCSLRLRANQRRSSIRRSTGLLPLVCCFDREHHRTRRILSNTHWCKTRPTAHCYATLRRDLHARIAEALENQFVEIATNQPELLARHCAEAGLIEKAAGLWGKAGRRSSARSALLEATEQLGRALGQIASLPATPALRREQIKLQVAMITPLIHVKGYAAPETKAAVERARLLVEDAEALGEPPEDPLLLFSLLYGFWMASYVAFNGDVMRNLAAQFLELAKKQGAAAPLLIAHRVTGMSLLHTGEIAQGREHFDRVIALYDAAEHRPLAARFGQDIRVAALSFQSLALWMLGFPEAALASSAQALKDAREIGQAATLMYAHDVTSTTHIYCGSYAVVHTQLGEVIALADVKGAAFWKAFAVMNRGCLLMLNGNLSDAFRTITSGLDAFRSTGATVWLPLFYAFLAQMYAGLEQFEDAWRCISNAINAMEATKERLWEAEVNRVAGDIALNSSEPDARKAEAYFERALTVARSQRAKSWELRAAMSMARLWRAQGKGAEARDLLVPVYGWFTEGFDTPDLKEAKGLLDELAT